MDYEEAYKKLFREWRHLNNKVNKVTAYYRHGNTPKRKSMVDLCNTQIDVEKAVADIESRLFINKL